MFQVNDRVHIKNFSQQPLVIKSHDGKAAHLNTPEGNFFGVISIKNLTHSNY